jgi:transcriptional regulator with PAS, ATPase and Fis domain
VNITAIPADLLESELFGYEKGAFTGADKKKTGRFEEANNGTILLDEIGDMSVDLQSKLLRVLEEKKFYKLGSQKPTSFNCRIVTSTNKNLEELIDEKKFRDDLFYRLNTISIDLPPLRERKEDIPHLISFFLEKYLDRNGSIKTIDNNAIEALTSYEWPGNIRELENTIKKLSIMSSNSNLSVDDIEEYFPKIFSKSREKESNLNYNLLIENILNKQKSSNNKYKNIIKKVKTTIIESTLIKCKGDRSKAIKELGLVSDEFDVLVKDLKISKELIKSD